ncbi:hypothetical protein BE20_00755 [Sorangium cellulosum]|uniref:Uncharacterized protein n=1 Tax=Sorangium cellulosum TaxID=56 RepID=A0A150RES7_SORCE|nr:hypothetical protein BE18_23330 [Sorangium cellulosum]KYF94220.1 hypothetical protein BE20_00755 [Sorangium cellulosum]
MLDLRSVVDDLARVILAIDLEHLDRFARGELHDGMDGVHVLRCTSFTDPYVSIERDRPELLGRRALPERGREKRPAVNTAVRRHTDGILPGGVDRDRTGEKCSLSLQSTLCDVEYQPNETRELAHPFAMVIAHKRYIPILMVDGGLDGISRAATQSE